MGMPTNERMDGAIEKATELGAAGFVPLMCERSVLRLSGERAERKVQHWQGVARAACEQSGRTRVPEVCAVQTLSAWLAALPAEVGGGEGRPQLRWILSLRDALPLASRLASAREALLAPDARVLVLSGPEGGLSPAEEALAREHGFLPVSLGPRVLRADTAPPAVVAQLGLWLSMAAG
jgi:16S rRNA (uracil1498-N3)-methyltransferase